MITLVILIVAYAIIGWRVLTVEDRQRRSSAGVTDLLDRVGHLEDGLARLRNERLAAARDS